MFSISFLSSSTSLYETSFFDSIRAARRHFSWLQGQGWASNVRLYRGTPGSERLQ